MMSGFYVSAGIVQAAGVGQNEPPKESQPATTTTTTTQTDTGKDNDNGGSSK